MTTKNNRRRGFLASQEGVKKLEERMREKGLTQAKLAEVAKLNSDDQVKRLLNPHWNKRIQKDAIEKIAEVLELKPTEIVNSEEWYPTSESNVHEKTEIDWLQVCHAMLDNQQEQQRIRRKASEMGFEVNVHVPLGLVERKQQQRREQNIEREQIYQLEKEVITKTYEHDDFLQQVISQSPVGKNKHIAIVGEPGAGKTTLLSAIALYIKHNTPKLPVFISLGSLQGMTLEDYFLKKWLPDAMRLVNLIPNSEIEEQLKTHFYKGDFCLLLDGVDEMGESSPVEALNKISRGLTNWLGQARVILTCRLNVWDASINNNILPGFHTYKTQEFKPEQVNEFIYQWFNRAGNIQRGEELKAKLTEPGKERIRELVTNPLRLSLLCQIFYQDEQGELPETKAQFYEIFTRYFYEWKPELVPDVSNSYQLKQELHQSLGKLALAGINSDVRFRLKRSLAVEEMGEKFFKLGCDLGWLNQVDRDAVNDEDVYAFFHPNFQEYFAALVIDDWHYFLNHVPQNPDEGVYRVFEPKWKEVILLWFGNKNGGGAYQDKKEEFIKALFNFHDNCNNFYWYQSNSLASSVITEYQECSIAEGIVWRISFWILGLLNEEEDKYHEFPAYIQDLGRKCLLTTNRKLAASIFEFLLAEKIEKKEFYWVDFENLGLIEPGNDFVTSVMLHCLEKSKNWSTREEAARILGSIAFGNSKAINALLKVIRTNLDDEIANSPDYDSEKDVNKFQQKLSRVVISNSKKDLDFIASASLYEIAPGNLEAIKTIISLSYWNTELGCFTHDNSIELLKKIATNQPEVVLQLRKKLQSNNEALRGAAAEIIAKVEPHNTKVIDILIDLLCNGSKEVVFSQDFFTGQKIHDDIEITYRDNAKQALISVGIDNLIIINKLIDLLSSIQESETIVRITNILAKIGAGNTQVISVLTNVLRNNSDEKISKEIAEHLLLADPGNPEAIDTLVNLLNNSEDEIKSRNLMRKFKEVAIGNDKVIEFIVNLLPTFDDIDTWELALRTLEKIAANTHNINAINALTMLLDTYTGESMLYTIAALLLIIDPGNERATEVLSKWFPFNMQSGFAKRLWANLNIDKIPEKMFSTTSKKESQEEIWHCAQNMTYPEFYHVWHSSKLSLQNLEHQFTDTHSLFTQLQPTNQTYPLTLNLKTLQEETDISAISQEICNQIYFTAFNEIEEIPEVNNAPQLKRIIPQIKKHFQTENLALIINNCKPNQAIITFCNKLTDVLHIAFITEQPLDAPLRGFPPNQSNLLSAIQNWIHEIE
ncbi:NACHT C-terminal alpha/beta 1 domain-containing protein [Nodularia spumigena]|uniref:NACHT domain-containing protein n=2 Tax=Nodularia spumigena TaxID=70799 RepID=A0ABU5UWU6_NODSP|nr:NACHT domain-containing protein [Nodularia spumigena]MEA5527461.1 NACHT domain-containing protein [Nodularia spumigena UHCC 0143]MEA5610005.1 NACHT domain-containing protein [Nodularia spumigena UHCC 0060]MEA5613529.1 NACHT domain-containing protein [Nodularia spumigena UHCC 0040]